MRSKASLIRSSGNVWVIIGSISICLFMYQSTIFGTSVRPRAPPKAVPRQTRPVTSWNGRVLISWPAPATPMMIDWPQPLWQASSAIAHDLHIADAFEGVVGAAAGQFDEMGDEIALDVVRIDEMRHAEALAPGLAVVVEIDADDHVGADKPQALDDIEADAAEPEDDAVRARSPPWRC